MTDFLSPIYPKRLCRSPNTDALPAVRYHSEYFNSEAGFFKPDRTGKTFFRTPRNQKTAPNQKKVYFKKEWLRHLDSTRSEVREHERRRAVRRSEAKRNRRAATSNKNPGAERDNRKYQLFPNAKRETATRQKTN